MPVPVNYPLNADRMSATVAAGVGNATNSLGAPWTGRVVKVGITLGSAVTTAATLTVDIAGTAIPGGVITIPTGGTAGTTISAIVNAPCNEDDGIDFVFSGAGVGGGVANVFAVVKAGG